MDIFKVLKEKYKYLLAVVILGVFLIMLTPTDEPVETINASYDVLEIETKLEEILYEIKGVGRVKVMLTIGESDEKIYATDTNIREDETQSEVVLVGNNDALEVKILYPKFRGALVVCDGADDPRINLEIILAVKSLCDISSENIQVTKMKD